MADTLIKVDRNGTKYYADYTCQRCGGAGASDRWIFTGRTCYECGGSGKSTKPHTYKVYTDEYRAKLDARAKARNEKRIAKLEEQAEDTRKEWLSKNQFDADGNTYVFLGDTYTVKDQLKALGAKYDRALGWHINKVVDGYTTKVININDIAVATLYGYTLDYAKVAEKMAEQEEQPASEYIGNVGDKITVEVTIANIAWWESQFGTQYLYSFKDAQGNVLVWKTSTGLYTQNEKGGYITYEKGDKVTIKATIKDHSEYKEVKQTVLTRCKVAK